ncbi:MAG: hypothetical protein ACR2OF_01880 [Hyphomicrobium sp.]
MSTSNSVRKLELLARIELMRLRLAASTVATQASLIAFAILLGVGGIAMLTLCLYTILAERYGLVVGALATGILLLVVAWVIAWWAGRIDGGQEAKTLSDLEEMVVDDIKSDVARVEANIRRLEAGAMSVMSGEFLRHFMGRGRAGKEASNKEAESEESPNQEA